MFSAAEYCYMAMRPSAFYPPFTYNSCPAYRSPVCLPGYPRPVEELSWKALKHQANSNLGEAAAKRNPFSIESILSGSDGDGKRHEQIHRGFEEGTSIARNQYSFNSIHHIEKRKRGLEYETEENGDRNEQITTQVIGDYDLKLAGPSHHKPDGHSYPWGFVSRSHQKAAKRIRTIFTNEQLQRLENAFKRQQYMVGAKRVVLATELNLSESQVKVWFQNRRIKWRKENHERDQSKLAEYRTRRDEIRQKLGLSARRVKSPEEIRGMRLLDRHNDITDKHAIKTSDDIGDANEVV